MLVSKTINNNIVACVSPEGREMIAMGRGIGFEYKAGTVLPSERIEKIFAIEDKSGYDDIKNLFSKLPEKHIEVCINIIEYAKEVLGCHLNDSVYLTLTDHVSFQIARMSEGMVVGSALSSEVKVFYPREFMIGRYALNLIKSELGVVLPEDEAASIALHIANAEFSTGLSSIVRITQTIKEILTIVERQVGIEMKDDDIRTQEFISFLKFLVFRTFTEGIEERGEEEELSVFLEKRMDGLKKLVDAIERHLFASSHKKLGPFDKALLESNIYCFVNSRGRRN